MNTSILRRAAPAIAIAACVILLPLVAAHAQDLTADANRAGTWAIRLVRACGILFVIGALLGWGFGRLHWSGGLIVMFLGVVGAAKADVIAPALFGS